MDTLLEIEKVLIQRDCDFWEGMTSLTCPRCRAPLQDGVCETMGCWHLDEIGRRAYHEAWLGLRDAMFLYWGVAFNKPCPLTPDHLAALTSNALTRWAIAHTTLTCTLTKG